MNSSTTTAIAHSSMPWMPMATGAVWGGGAPLARVASGGAGAGAALPASRGGGGSHAPGRRGYGGWRDRDPEEDGSEQDAPRGWRWRGGLG
jgi:hypothetical protein